MLLRLLVKGCLKPWTADLGRLKQIITIFQDKSKKGKSSGIPTLQIVRFPRLVYYRNHERSDVIYLASSGIWTASHFAFAVLSVLFSFSKLRGRRPRQSIPSLVYYRNHERSNVIHFTSSGTVDCFTLRVRSFEYLIFFFEIARP